MVATGICQSDAYYMKNGGFSSAGVFPAILGHEGSGIVESIGEGVTRFKKGMLFFKISFFILKDQRSGFGTKKIITKNRIHRVLNRIYLNMYIHTYIIFIYVFII